MKKGGEAPGLLRGATAASCKKEREDAAASPLLVSGLFSSAAAIAPLFVHVELGQLAVGALHKLLQLVLKAGRSPGLGGFRGKAAPRSGTAAGRTAFALGPGGAAAGTAGKKGNVARHEMRGMERMHTF